MTARDFVLTMERRWEVVKGMYGEFYFVAVCDKVPRMRYDRRLKCFHPRKKKKVSHERKIFEEESRS